MLALVRRDLQRFAKKHARRAVVAFEFGLLTCKTIELSYLTNLNSQQMQQIQRVREEPDVVGCKEPT